MSCIDRQPRRWTSAEDQTLREQVDAQQAQGGGRDWCQIALTLPGRTNKDCRKRWHNSVAEGLKKGQWSKSEDQLLIHGVHRYGSQWTKVATCVSSRSADQCAKRWQQSLDPRLDRSEWRENEDVALLAAVERLGRHWKDIQEQYLPHRSKNCVKNRYSVLARRTNTQLVSYDDSLGSSSSDPGTPMQMEADLRLDLTSTPLLHATPQPTYISNHIPRSSNEVNSWSWSDCGDPNAPSTTSQHESFNHSPWLTYPNVHPSQILSSNQIPWNEMQLDMASRHPVQYPNNSAYHAYSYTYPTQQQPHMSDFSRGASMTQSIRPSMQSVSLSNPPSYRGQSSLPYRDSAPFS